MAKERLSIDILNLLVSHNSLQQTSIGEDLSEKKKTLVCVAAYDPCDVSPSSLEKFPEGDR